MIAIPKEWNKVQVNGYDMMIVATLYTSLEYQLEGYVLKRINDTIYAMTCDNGVNRFVKVFGNQTVNYALGVYHHPKARDTQNDPYWPTPEQTYFTNYTSYTNHE